MSAVKHLIIILDGERQDNSLHADDQSRAEYLLEMAKSGTLGKSIHRDLPACVQYVDANFTASGSPSAIDYAESVIDLMQERDFDVYLDDLEVPEAAAQKATS